MSPPPTWPSLSRQPLAPGYPSGTFEGPAAGDLSALHHGDRPMTKGTIYRERTSAWFVAIAAVIALAGVGLIRLSESLASYPMWKPVVANVGGLVVASVALGILWELWGRRIFVEEVFDAAAVSREIQDARIAGVTTKFQEGVDWTKILDGARELDLLVTAARTWRNSLDHSLRELAARPKATINLILPDPEDPEVLRELSRRFSTGEEGVARLIREAEEHFKDLAARASMRKGGLNIWYLKEAPLFTFYRIDSTYVLSTYRHAGKGDVPTLVCYKNGSIARFIDEQMERLLDKKAGQARLSGASGKRTDVFGLT